MLTELLNTFFENYELPESMLNEHFLIIVFKIVDVYKCKL